jgi:probable phosphoglycerate mutase
MRLLLVSHAETEWNVQGRFQGHKDIPLNERGRRQALALQQHLAKETVDFIISSDLCRAGETATILARPHGLVVQTDARLRELHFGAWEGLTFAEISEREPESFAAWQASSLYQGPPHGESLSDLARRLNAFLSDLLHNAEGSTTLLVAHRGSLRTLLCLLLKVPVEKHWEYGLKIASLTELKIVAENAELVRLNETIPESNLMVSLDS